ncbi:Hypothetical protein CINCED_3A024805 [Cinara cedri]|uniref:Uncharacterized protein n=1 Tax=Cinara cedri TaxID=506608 RepID=A0A5E4MJK2_9HEMI|nr:Hypothetical protein CINCED_3A024805 [Cinara cedri]
MSQVFPARCSSLAALEARPALALRDSSYRILNSCLEPLRSAKTRYSPIWLLGKRIRQWVTDWPLLTSRPASSGSDDRGEKGLSATRWTRDGCTWNTSPAGWNARWATEVRICKYYKCMIVVWLPEFSLFLAVVIKLFGNFGYSGISGYYILANIDAI